MTWRREDYGYAAATVGAVVLLGYLIAGNFGLVPSPFGLGRGSELPQAEVAALVVSNTAPASFPAPGVAPALPHRVARSDESQTLAAPPTIVIDSKSGTRVTVAQKATVVGRVLAPAGVKSVVVRFAPSSGSAATVLATGNCTGIVGRMCGWDAAVPSTLGTYNVSATVTDVAGRSANSNTITMTVVNTGNVVTGVVSGVGKTVNGATTLVTKAPALLGGVLNNLLNALHL